jgi:signal transduction histidine kinase
LEEQQFVHSSLSPGPVQKRLALGIVLGLLVALGLIAGPFAGIQLGANSAFVPIYTTAMFVTDSITAVLLYTQFSILRTRATLVIASGYLFTAIMVVLYFLAFPGLLAPNGLFGGMQTGAWLYVSWHCGLAIFVVGYGLSREENPGKRIPQRKVHTMVLCAVALTFAVAATVAYVCISKEAVLPRIMATPAQFTPQWPYLVGAPIASLCLVAIVVLWVRRRSILDLWLMVVMFLFLIEVPLSYYPVPARFSTGWYAVRIVGIISSSIILTLLLYEITTLYTRLLTAVLGQRREREARLMTGDAVAASIAHEVRQPLTAMITTADAGLRFLDRAEPNLDKAKEAFKRIAADGHRAGALIADIRANFKSDVRERATIDLNELIQECLALARRDLQQHGILVEAEPNRELPEVRGNRTQLQQVLLNLIMNAVESMAANAHQRTLSVAAEADERGHVRVSVADTGTGIATKDADRLFNPLFTTKPSGMGMGLSICRAIIEAHEGQLGFVPNTPRGAVFQFTLQAKAPAASAG